MKTNTHLLLLLVLFGSCTPLRTDKYAIHFEASKIATKQQFLDAPIPESNNERPNIIIILADDLGFHDISLHGSPYIQTKNIDKLAKEGVNCINAYTSSPVCAPSRAGLLTGRYQHRFGFENQMHQRLARNRFEQFWARNLMQSHPWRIKKSKTLPREEDMKRQGLPPTEITLAEMFKKHGYQTAAIGKWHLGSAEHSLPNNLGFDYHYGFYNSHSLFAPEGTAGIVDMRNKKDWTDKYIWSGQRNGDCAMYRNGQEIEEGEYLTHRFAEEAIQFIEKNKDKPFFLYIPFSAPHTPLQVPETYYQQFEHIKDPIKRTYNAMIAVLDEAVGQINASIKDLGLEENTLIFFLSDNGGAAYTLTTDNAPLNGGKITAFEGGLRVPFFIKWKGQIEEKMVYENRVSSLDIFTTACAAAGLELPMDRKYDGVNLLPFFQNAAINQSPHETLYWKAGIYSTIIHQDWKLFFDETRTQVLLFDLKNDPYEKNNLAEEFPKRVEELMDLHQTWAREMPPPMWPTIVTFEHSDQNGVYYFEN